MSEAAVTSPPRTLVPRDFRRSLNDALEMAHGVDAVAVEERANSLAKRSLKKQSKVWGLKLAISMIDRGAFLSGDYHKVFDEIADVKEACGPAHLKVILETGELANYDQVRKASLIAMYAGADFIKTSTGKVTVNATLPVTLVMFEAIRDFEHVTGKKIGMKPAGGIGNAKLALAYLVLLYETMGPEWMTPDLFRLGASSLLNDVLMQLRKEKTGAYQSGDYFTLD